MDYFENKETNYTLLHIQIYQNNREGLSYSRFVLIENKNIKCIK